MAVIFIVTYIHILPIQGFAVYGCYATKSSAHIIYAKPDVWRNRGTFSVLLQPRKIQRQGESCCIENWGL